MVDSLGDKCLRYDFTSVIEFNNYFCGIMLETAWNVLCHYDSKSYE